MTLRIKIDNFEGPFDLLLHLIRKNEMDIYNIKIAEITNQYMQYINSMKSMDLEITSEFIVIAATLLQIKSKQLLPKVKDIQEQEQEESIDPEKELIEKLIEYRKFKATAEFFKSKMDKEGMVFTKKAEIIDEPKSVDNTDILKNVTMVDLYNLYNKIINKYNEKMNFRMVQKEIVIDTYKVEDKVLYIKDKLNKENKMKFSSIMSECNCKMEIIVTFLAILELAKLRNLNLIQENNFNEIYIEGVGLIE